MYFIVFSCMYVQALEEMDPVCGLQKALQRTAGGLHRTSRARDRRGAVYGTVEGPSRARLETVYGPSRDRFRGHAGPSSGPTNSGPIGPSRPRGAVPGSVKDRRVRRGPSKGPSTDSPERIVEGRTVLRGVVCDPQRGASDRLQDWLGTALGPSSGSSSGPSSGCRGTFQRLPPKGRLRPTVGPGPLQSRSGDDVSEMGPLSDVVPRRHAVREFRVSKGAVSPSRRAVSRGRLEGPFRNAVERGRLERPSKGAVSSGFLEGPSKRPSRETIEKPSPGAV
ncbi:hypothetical protein M885DRAFT_78711 [Pelagophyceae sp. CCMP2097]|nr:hypothetical protein M885DRAFT_78711 [Pelagophyceae sp. CCMP2097]